MELLDSGTPLTRAFFTELEKRWNIVFPEDYVCFMLNQNGGEPAEDWLFDFVDAATEKRNTSVVRGFYVLYTEDQPAYDDLVKICTVMWEEQTIGKDYLPFADDPGGNPICMCVAGDDYGKVYLANHEFEDTDTGYLLLSEVAPSFSAFIDMLYPDE